MRTEGVEFPFPSYLSNVVREIALNFQPRNPGALRADVFFIIRRDGRVDSIRFITRSGSHAFDVEALGAIEAAGNGRRFGPLPDGFANDFLPIVFSFDPTIIR